MNDHNNMKIVGRRIRRLRKDLDLTQEEFSKNLNIATPTLSDLENGKTKPSYDVMLGLSTFYQVNLEYIVTGEGEIFKSKGNSNLMTLEENEFGIYQKDFLYIFDVMRKSMMFRSIVINKAKEYLVLNRNIIEQDMETGKVNLDAKSDQAEKKEDDT